MSKPFAVVEEQILVRLGDIFAPIRVRLFEPQEPRGAVLLLHGFTGNGRDFDGIGQFLADNGYMAICPDLPGRGESPPLTPSLYRIPTYVAIIMAILQKYSRSRTTMLGLGWGGILALVTLANLRGRKPRLILANVPARWTLAGDGELQWALGIASRTFADHETALGEALQAPSLRDLPPETARALASHRIRARGDGFGLSLDPALIENLADYGNTLYDLSALLADVGECLVMAASGSASAAARPVFAAVQKGGAALLCSEIGGIGLDLTLTDPVEWLQVLGAVEARQWPGQPGA